MCKFCAEHLKCYSSRSPFLLHPPGPEEYTVAKSIFSRVLISRMDFPPACGSSMACWWGQEAGHRGRRSTPYCSRTMHTTPRPSPSEEAIAASDSPGRKRRAVSAAVPNETESSQLTGVTTLTEKMGARR